MDKFEEALNSVKDELYSEPVVVEYFRLKNIIENDDSILSLEKEVRDHQKKMCESINNDEIYLLEKEAYEACLKELNSNPIYANFLKVKEEVIILLNEVKEALQ